MKLARFASTAALVALAAAAPALASSHREARTITERPKVDNTDVYAFRSYEPGRANFVTIIANFQPFQVPYGGPNFFTMDPDAVYEIHVDNGGDAIENLTFQFQFRNQLRNGRGNFVTVGGQRQPIPLRQSGQVTTLNDPDLGEPETYTLTQVTGPRRSGRREAIVNAATGSATFMKPFDNVGQKTIPDYNAYARQFMYDVRIPGCATNGRAFAGQRQEAFAVNLGPVFDLINFVPVDGASGFPGGITQSRENDDLVGEFNVTSLAIEVPIACLRGAGNGVIGVWATASLPANQQGGTGTAHVQQSRLGMPLVNELVIGLPDKDSFNAAEPRTDGQFGSYVTLPTFPVLVDALFRDAVNDALGTNIDNLAPKNLPRNDLVATFLTGLPGLNQLASQTPSEMLRLNMGVPPTPRAQQRNLGVIVDDLAGYPNGRRPGDDTVDITLRVAMGRLCHPVTLGGVATDLGYCDPEDAPIGTAALTDGAPITAQELGNAFPYLLDPIPGSPRSARPR